MSTIDDALMSASQQPTDDERPITNGDARSVSPAAAGGTATPAADDAAAANGVGATDNAAATD
ncbi:hypothetical protein, partial [Bifidobacterium choerinum]|uniref:hypothetical protein n=1 Tax=Bifidobacterium choerinum TaxID=35760 RepID=UPI003F9312BD